MKRQSTNKDKTICEAIVGKDAATSASEAVALGKADTKTSMHLNVQSSSKDQRLVTEKKPPSAETERLREPSPSRGFGLEGFTFALENLRTEKLPGYVKQHQHSLTFPEKLMLMLTYIERMAAKEGKRHGDEPIGWTLDGTAFVIRDKDRFVSTWLPRFFGKAKFPSFTRKLYRWEFRKLMPTAPPGSVGRCGEPVGEIVFASDNFRKDSPHLLSNMCSVTAAKNRNDSAYMLSRNDRGNAFPRDGLTTQVLPLFVQGSGVLGWEQRLTESSHVLLLRPPNQVIGDQQLTSAAVAQSASVSRLNNGGGIAPASLPNVDLWQLPAVGRGQPQPNEFAVSQYLEALQAGLSFNPLGLLQPHQAQLLSLRALLDQSSLQLLLRGLEGGENTIRAEQQQQSEQLERERQAAIDLLLHLPGLPRPPPPF